MNIIDVAEYCTLFKSVISGNSSSLPIMLYSKANWMVVVGKGDNTDRQNKDIGANIQSLLWKHKKWETRQHFFAATLLQNGNWNFFSK